MGGEGNFSLTLFCRSTKKCYFCVKIDWKIKKHIFWQYIHACGGYSVHMLLMNHDSQKP